MKKNIIVAIFALSIAGMTATLHGMERKKQSDKPLPRLPWGMARAYERDNEREKMEKILTSYIEKRNLILFNYNKLKNRSTTTLKRNFSEMEKVEQTLKNTEFLVALASYKLETLKKQIAETRLHKAAREDDLCVIKQIASEGNFDINSKDHPLEQTPLHVAVLFGNVEAVKFLLKKCEANPNTVDACKFYPLHASVSNCSEKGLEITSLLIKHRANLNAPDKERSTPLHLATRMNNPIAIRMLLENGAKPDKISIHPFYPTPILTAVHNGNLDIVKIFDELRVKIDINQTSILGRNLFYHMAYGCNNNPEIDKQNYIKIGKILLEWGCDIDNVDEQGSTPFSTAYFYFHSGIMKFIAKNLPSESKTSNQKCYQIAVKTWKNEEKNS